MIVVVLVLDSFFGFWVEGVKDFVVIVDDDEVVGDGG